MRPPEQEPQEITTQEELTKRRTEAFSESSQESAEPEPLEQASKETVGSFETGQSEPRELAQNIDNLSREGLALTGYFEQRKDLFPFAEAQELANDITLIEQRLIIPLKEKIAAEFPDAETEKIEEAIIGIREGLYSIILSGHLTAEKLLSKISAIEIKKTPGSEFREQSFDKDKAAAYYVIEGGRATIYFYGVFFHDEPPDAKAHHVRHEVAHILCETGGIWPQDVYLQFLEAAQYPTSDNIDAMTQVAAPLAEILKVLQSPDQHATVWSKYIRGRLEAISGLSPDKQGQEKIQVARELVAEMTSYFLEYGKNEGAYLARRLQFAEPEVRQKILDAISDPEKQAEFSSVFQANSLWFKHLQERFAERGKNIQSGIPQDIEKDYADDFYFEDDYEIPSPAPVSAGFAGKEATTERTVKSDNPLVAIWDFLTGKRTQAPPNVIGNVSPSKPEQIKKSA